MKLWAIIVGIATIASIASFLDGIVRNKPRWRLVASTFLAIIFAGLSGYLAFQNEELWRARGDAELLATNWPARVEYSPDGEGDYDGIITSGMIFLRRYRNQFPEAYEYAERAIATPARQVPANPYEQSTTFRKLRGAQAMITTIRSIAGKPVTVAPYR